MKDKEKKAILENWRNIEFGPRSWFCFDCEEDWDEGYIKEGEEPTVCTQCSSKNIKEIK